MNFSTAYRQAVGSGPEDDSSAAPLEDKDLISRDAWLRNPLTVDLLAATSKLSEGLIRYVVNTSISFEDHKERIKTTLQQVNTLENLRLYIYSGDFKQLTKDLNYKEK